MIPTSYFYRDLFERHWFGAEPVPGGSELLPVRAGWWRTAGAALWRRLTALGARVSDGAVRDSAIAAPHRR